MGKKNSLEEYPLSYEEPGTSKPRPLARPKTKPKKNKSNFTRKVREGIKRMSDKVKTNRKYAPTRLEVAKTVLIAVLITSVIAFVAGTSYQKSHQAEISAAVHAAVTAAAQPPTSK